MGSAARHRQIIELATSAVPALFAIPILAGIAVSIANLAATSHPLPGFIGSGINSDALALYHGFGLYHDPATGYLGSVYTPGLPLLVSVLDRVTLWSGWVPLICYAASFIVAGLAGWLACRSLVNRRRDGLFALAGAIGFAALSWWFLGALKNPSLYTGHLDHPAWALALGGLLIVPAAARGSRPAIAAVVVLLSLAMWTKQSAVAAPVAALAWLILQGSSGRRVALVIGLSLVAINGAILGLLALLTHGWAWRLLVDFGLNQPVAYGAGSIAHEFLDDHALVLISLAVVWGLALLPAMRRQDRDRERVSALARPYASLIVVFLVVAAVLSFQARRVQGGQDNDFIPLTWGLVLLLAVGYRALRPRPGAQIAGAAVLLALFVIGISATLKADLSDVGIRVPPTLHAAVRWPTPSVGIGPPPNVNALHSYYDWTGTAFSRDDRGNPYPSVTGILGALALGRHPNYLADALLERRFSAVQLFPRAFESGPIDDFASAQGRYEQHFLWKLNRVISSRYTSALTGLKGILIRRPGPEPDRWMRTCFAPLSLGSVSFDIGTGGGFWCELPGTKRQLTLVDTPAASSEIYTPEAITALRGQLGIELGTGAVKIGFGDQRAPAWWLQVVRSHSTAGVEVTAARTGKVFLRATILLPRLVASRAQLHLTFGTSNQAATPKVSGDAIALAAPPLRPGLSLWFIASRASGAQFQLARLALR